MISIVSEKQINKGSVQINTKAEPIHLVVSETGIDFLSQKNNVIVNSYEDNPLRSSFPNSDIVGFKDDYGYHYNMIYKELKPYIEYTSDTETERVQKTYFLPDKTSSLLVGKLVSFEDEESVVLTSAELQNILDYRWYQAFCLINKSTGVLCASQDETLLYGQKITIDDIISDFTYGKAEYFLVTLMNTLQVRRISITSLEDDLFKMVFQNTKDLDLSYAAVAKDCYDGPIVPYFDPYQHREEALDEGKSRILNNNQ